MDGVFYITDTELGVIHDGAYHDQGGESGWNDYSYDINEGGFLRNDSDYRYITYHSKYMYWTGNNKNK